MKSMIHWSESKIAVQKSDKDERNNDIQIVDLWWYFVLT